MTTVGFLGLGRMGAGMAARLVGQVDRLLVHDISADAVAALGGNPASLGQETPSAANAGLVNHAGRYGRAAGIRQTLAAEDLDYRRRRDGRLLERIFNTNVYYRAYAPMSLDQYAELEYWRARGVRNVGAPPESVATARRR